jgi:hypothetical protein
MLEELPASAKMALGDTALVNQDETTTNQPLVAETRQQPMPVPADNN